MLCGGAVADRLHRALYQLHVFGSRATSRESVRELIRDLRPVRGDHHLIRLGPAGDGGYLLPDDFEGLHYCFSPGVAKEAGFEADLASRGLTVFMADASVDRPPIDSPQFHFRKRFVGAFDDATFLTLDSWKSDEIGSYDGDLLLQMDIEGAEYESLLAASSSLIRQFRVMVIEFHHLDHLMEPVWFRLAASLFRRLLKTHAIVHIHPNNCCGTIRAGGIEIPRVAEFTFHRRDRLGPVSINREFPHPLDADNTSNRSLVLPEIWYEGDRS